MTPFRGQRSKVKVTRPINAVTENQPYPQNRKAYELQTWYTDGLRWPYHRQLWWPHMSKVKVMTCSGVGTNFGVGDRRGEARPEGPRAGVGGGVLWEGAAIPPLHQLGGLVERCKLLQRGPGRSHGRRRVFLYSVPSDCLSQHLSTCCIQFAWLGIRGVRTVIGEYTYRYSPT